MFDLFPGYNKFRAVTMVITLALTVLPLMAFLGLEKFVSTEPSKTSQKPLLYSAGIALVVALFAWVVTDPPAVEGIQQVIADAIDQDRKQIIQSDVMRSIFYVVMAAGLVFFYLKKKVGNSIFYAAIALLVLLDLGLVDSRYLNDSVFVKPAEHNYLSLTPADEKIIEDESPGYRVLNLQDPFNEARTSNFHHSLGGYHGAKIRRYQDVISQHLVPEIQQIIEDQGINKDNTGVISMLNAKYIMAGLQENAVIPNQYYNGAAWIVQELKEVNSPDDEIKSIGEVDLQKTAVIDVSKFDPKSPTLDSTATIELVDYAPNHLKYQSTQESEALAVFSEIYYPEGWKAFINGKPAEIMRANYLLRALNLPSGNNTVEFVFEPASYFIGNRIMMISSIILLLVVAYGLFRLWKGQSNSSASI